MERHFEANNEIVRVRITARSEWSDRILLQAEHLVRDAGEVPSQGLHDRIRSAGRIAIAESGGVVIAMAALKVPAPTYRARVFHHAGLTGEDKYPYEVGYVVVEPDHRGRGLATRVVAACLAGVTEFIFATSRADNAGIHRVLESNGFRRQGVAYPSSRGAYDLVAHVRDPGELRNQITTEPNREAERRGQLRCHRCGKTAKWHPWGDAWVAACTQDHAPGDDWT